MFGKSQFIERGDQRDQIKPNFSDLSLISPSPIIKASCKAIIRT
jgi:hypothetical protein